MRASGAAAWGQMRTDEKRRLSFSSRCGRPTPRDRLQRARGRGRTSLGSGTRGSPRRPYFLEGHGRGPGGRGGSNQGAPSSRGAGGSHIGWSHVAPPGGLRRRQGPALPRLEAAAGILRWGRDGSSGRSCCGAQGSRSDGPGNPTGRSRLGRPSSGAGSWIIHAWLTKKLPILRQIMFKRLLLLLLPLLHRLSM